jgi:hypothetical protein
MVQTPGSLIESYRDWSQKLAHAPCEFWTSGCGILNFVKLARKPSEVMNRPRRFHGGDGDLGDVPVC